MNCFSCKRRVEYGIISSNIVAMLSDYTGQLNLKQPYTAKVNNVLFIINRGLPSMIRELKTILQNFTVMPSIQNSVNTSLIKLPKHFQGIRPMTSKVLLHAKLKSLQIPYASMCYLMTPEESLGKQTTIVLESDA